MRTEIMTPAMRPKVRTVFFMRGSCGVRMESRCGVTGPDVVILSGDFGGNGAEIVLSGEDWPSRRTPLGKQPHGRRPNSLPRWTAWVRRAAPSLSKARAQWVLTVFSETKSWVAISRLLWPRATRVRISSSRAVMPRVCWRAVLGAKGSRALGGDKHFFHDDGFADGFAAAGDAEAEPDAEGREEDGDEGAVELDGVRQDDEAVFGVLEGGDEEAADDTEDEDVALHGGIGKKYIAG